MPKFRNLGADVNAVRRADQGGPLVKGGSDLEVDGEIVKPPTKKQLADAGLDEAPQGLQYMQVGTRPDDKGKEQPVFDLVPDDATYVQTEDGLRAFPTALWELVTQKADDKDKE